MPKKGGATFGYVEQFNYPLSPCYKNQAKAGWHSGGDGSCGKKSVEGLTSENEISGGGFFDWIMGKGDKKKSTSTSGKKKKSTSSSTSGKKKKTTSSSSATSDKKKKKKKSTSTSSSKKK
jgi:hypothetical protein